jgi:hypothetical protein
MCIWKILIIIIIIIVVVPGLSKILDLVGRQRARGRPSHSGRPHDQYRVRFPGLDHHYDVWLTEKTLRQRYPSNADMLIQSFDEKADP